MSLSAARFVVLLLLSSSSAVRSLNIVVAGGTGKVGRQLSSELGEKGHAVTVLARNAFLASTPSRVSHDYGWLGESFLLKNGHIRLRDWDGGDLLDIVGKDWVGWQDETLPRADVVVNLVGGYTEQRTMAAERIVRECLRLNPSAMQITLSPMDEDVGMKLKIDRLDACEKMVQGNCQSSACLRAEIGDIKGACEQIMNAIESVNE